MAACKCISMQRLLSNVPYYSVMDFSCQSLGNCLLTLILIGFHHMPHTEEWVIPSDNHQQPKHCKKKKKTTTALGIKIRSCILEEKKMQQRVCHTHTIHQVIFTHQSIIVPWMSFSLCSPVEKLVESNPKKLITHALRKLCSLLWTTQIIL